MGESFFINPDGIPTVRHSASELPRFDSAYRSKSGFPEVILLESDHQRLTLDKVEKDLCESVLFVDIEDKPLIEQLIVLYNQQPQYQDSHSPLFTDLSDQGKAAIHVDRGFITWIHAAANEPSSPAYDLLSTSQAERIKYLTNLIVENNWNLTDFVTWPLNNYELFQNLAQSIRKRLLEYRLYPAHLEGQHDRAHEIAHSISHYTLAQGAFGELVDNNLYDLLDYLWGNEINVSNPSELAEHELELTGLLRSLLLLIKFFQSLDEARSMLFEYSTDKVVSSTTHISREGFIVRFAQLISSFKVNNRTSEIGQSVGAVMGKRNVNVMGASPYVVGTLILMTGGSLLGDTSRWEFDTSILGETIQESKAFVVSLTENMINENIPLLDLDLSVLLTRIEQKMATIGLELCTILEQLFVKSGSRDVRVKSFFDSNSELRRLLENKQSSLDSISNRLQSFYNRLTISNLAQ